ncbi:DUF898 family protein [Hyphococcus formosus]|uniref:YjgN family protein n=1 Tax=Hyphococcus formosus TaxID=3143534 RepID=UPI00398A6C97
MTNIDYETPPTSGDGDALREDLTIRNKSSVGPMLWIGFYTSILNIFTLTLFRFWGRTNFRRRLWADTRIGNEPLEYTGRGLELFIGFFIAIFTLMLPFIGIIFAIQFFIGPDTIFLSVVPLLMYAFLFFILGVAIFLARRYHLSRTRFRGIRFAQTGSALGYGVATFGYLILTIITLGWYGPAARIKLSRKLWDNAYFGSEPFSFTDTDEAKAEPVYKSFAFAWVGTFAAYGLWVAWFFTSRGGNLAETTTALDLESIGKLYLSLIPLTILIAIFVSWHEAVMIRRIVKSLNVAGANFSSRMKTFDIIELAITNTLLVIFTLGFGFMASQMRVWKRIANRMELAGTIDFAKIQQTTEEAPKQGEGLADGLDIVSNF